MLTHELSSNLRTTVQERTDDRSMLFVRHDQLVVRVPGRQSVIEDGFWSDQDEMPPPVGAEAADHQPEETVPGLQVGSRTRTAGDLELVA